MKILVEGDGILLNQYSVMIVNPKRCKDVDVANGEKFSNWITGKHAQQLIGDFKLLGKQLFTPNAR